MQASSRPWEPVQGAGCAPAAAPALGIGWAVADRIGLPAAAIAAGAGRALVVEGLDRQRPLELPTPGTAGQQSGG